MELLTEHDVVNQQFKEPATAAEGYDQDEVDYFLDQVAATIGELTKKNTDLENQVKVAQAKVAELNNGAGAPAQASAAEASPSENAAGILALAQELHDKYVSEGEAERDRLVSEANTKHDQIVSQAEAQSKNTLDKLATEQAVVEHKISDLRDFESDYRTRLKSYLQSLLQNVENGKVHMGDQN
ncbi:MAG: DivIVA domain-containing protein [Actinomycetaceae bacterium]|nr:DivIVA domain-containing protein [Actinomycetaceae bacterium]MDY6083043.1 DivIVA domain-containing protein [Actinomycetaceae bacterium]